MKKSDRKHYTRGRKEMRREIVAALKQAHASDTGYDEHERGEACAQCRTWYAAVDTAKSVRA